MDTSSSQEPVWEYLRRVKSVICNRSFIEGESCHDHSQLVGFGPPGTEVEDIIVILFGCSVPVVLRPKKKADLTTEYELMGEAYIYGNMDGEVSEEECGHEDFKLI
jgi:hypothetical protein